MSTAARFTAELAQRLDSLYRDQAELGEVAPGARLRLEGWIEAGLQLELVTREEVERLVADAWSRRRPGEVPPLLPDTDGGIALPVRWQRAPVYAS